MVAVETPGAEGAISGATLELARTVLIHGPISRTDVMRLLEMSPPTLTRLARELTAGGIFVEDSEPGGAVGRPPKFLDVRWESRRYLGVKLTGSSAVAVSTDLRATELDRREYTFAEPSLDAVCDAVVRAHDELSVGGGFAAVGVSLGGAVTDRRFVIRAPFLGWRDVDLGRELERRLGLPTVVENDIVALTEAQHWFGAGRGLTDFAVITIGAGVGHGYVCDDRVVRSDKGIGLAGHIRLDPLGPLCPDGHRGCATAMLTIPSLCAQASVALGRGIEFGELLALAAERDPMALAITEPAGRALGRLLALAANLGMVSTIVLAGEGLPLYEATESIVLEAMQAERDAEADPIDLRLDSADFVGWARGAAAVAIQSSVHRLI